MSGSVRILTTRAPIGACQRKELEFAGRETAISFNGESTWLAFIYVDFMCCAKRESFAWALRILSSWFVGTAA